MTEIEFLNLYRSQKELLFAFGKFVRDLIVKEIENKLRVEGTHFLKIPLNFRIKDDDSIIQKAFYRKKNYSDPYNEITDKVGLRIVVLLQEDVRDVCNIIERLEGFLFSKDKDFDLDRLNTPERFAYQSNHYIIRNSSELNLGFVIPAGTPVEVQIRTLLQHAYSELTHDTVYKPNTYASPEIERQVAQSMALIEVTDNLFSRVNNSLKKSKHLFNQIINELTTLFPSEILIERDEKISEFLLDAFSKEIETYNLSSVKRFMQEYSYLWEKIAFRSKNKLLFRLPIIPLIYYLVKTSRQNVKQRWPLDLSILEPIFTDLGISFSRI